MMASSSKWRRRRSIPRSHYRPALRQLPPALRAVADFRHRGVIPSLDTVSLKRSSASRGRDSQDLRRTPQDTRGSASPWGRQRSHRTPVPRGCPCVVIAARLISRPLAARTPRGRAWPNLPKETETGPTAKWAYPSRVEHRARAVPTSRSRHYRRAWRLRSSRACGPSRAPRASRKEIGRAHV